MAGAVYFYTPGGVLAVCGSRVATLVDLPPDAGLVPGLYDLIGDESAGLDEVLELLVSPGLRAVEHFALAEHTEEGLRTVVRGRFRALAGSHTIEGRGLWTDRIIQSDGYTLLDPDAPEAGPLPLTAGGIVLAGRVERRAGNAPVTPRVAPPVQSPDEPPRRPEPPRVAAEDAPVTPEPGPEEAAPDEPGSRSGTLPTGAIPPGATNVSGFPNVSGVPASPGLPSVPGVHGPGVAPLPLPAAAPVAMPSSAEPARTVAAAVRPDTGTDSPAGGASELNAPTTGHTLPTPFTSPVADLPAPPPSPSAEEERPTFIDSLPWSSPDDEPAAAPGDGPAGPASERTISRDQLPRVGVQTVVAARCPAGHLSPAYAGTCRVCGQPLPQQQPVEVPRPPLGVLRLSNGDTVVLDRGCILGRNPRVPAGYSGEQPNLVKLIDPDKDISGQHLEVRLEYWHVAVKDLGSTNGTQVIPPGEHPVTLRPNDPVMIEPGTKVVLAGVFSFTFEVPSGP